MSLTKSSLPIFILLAVVLVGGWIVYRQSGQDLPPDAVAEDDKPPQLESSSTADPIAALEAEYEKLKKLVEREPIKSRPQLDDFLEKTGPSHHVLDLLSQSYAIETRNARTVEEQADICEAQIKHYAKISKEHPHWSELLYRLASQRVVYQRLRPALMEELDAAVEELERVITLGMWDDKPSEEASGYFQLGRTIKHQGDTYNATNKKHLVAERYDAALKAFEKTLEIAPERIDALGEIVLIYLAGGKLEVATKAVREHMPKVEAPNLRGKMFEMYGELLKRQGDLEGAIESFQTALNNNPKLMGSYLHLAVIYHTQSQYDKVESIYKRSVEEEPRFIEGHFALGTLFKGYHRFPDAIRTFQHLLDVPKEDAVFTGMLPSHVLYRNNLYYQAAEQLAEVQFQQGDYQKALKAALDAATHQELQAPLADLTGRIYLAQSKPKKAMAFFQTALRLSDLPAAHLHLAQVFIQEKDLEQARRHLTQAVESAQEFPGRKEAEKLLNDLSD